MHILLVYVHHLKAGKCHPFLPSAMHACCHDPWESLMTAKPCKGETQAQGQQPSLVKNIPLQNLNKKIMDGSNGDGLCELDG